MQSLTLPKNELYHKLNEFVRKQAENIVFAISMLFVFLFAYTAHAKLTDHATFERMLSKSEVVGSFSAIISWAVPIAEIVISVLLLIPLFFKAEKVKRTGLWAAIILMSIFTLYLIYMVLFADKLLCNCGGVISTMGWKTHILFNLAFVAIGIIALKLNKPIKTNT